MARNRVVTGFGPTKLSLTQGTTGIVAGDWIPFGPFDASKFAAQIVFAPASSAFSKLQATMTTATTLGVKTIINQTGNNSGVYKFSTYTTGVFSRIRLYSSGMNATGTAKVITAYFGALS
jgi:hypothetical protein